MNIILWFEWSLSSKAMQPSLVKKLVGLLSQTFVFWTTKYRTIFILTQAIRRTNIIRPTYNFVLWIFEKFTYYEKVWAAYGHSTSHCCRDHQVKNVSRNLGPKNFATCKVGTFSTPGWFLKLEQSTPLYRLYHVSE